jgi:hypothetical protein
MVKASVEKCGGRRLGAISIIADESLHEYPTAITGATTADGCGQ